MVFEELLGEGLRWIERRFQTSFQLINPLIRCVQALLQGVTLSGDLVEVGTQYIPHGFMPAFARIPHIVLAPFTAA